MLSDLVKSDPGWRIAILRYFNPVGAHESGLIGENPKGLPNNLLPYITQIAICKLPELVIFVNDYPTSDDTGVRDYIHVMYLAEGHLRALNTLEACSGAQVWNLGTGHGYSVLEILYAFEAVSGISVPFRIAPRRPGDIAVCYVNVNKAELDLGWKAQRELKKMMLDSWNWQLKNPNGYN